MENIFNTIVGLVSRIGNMFGNATGLRIGGPLVTGIIVILVIWKLWGRIPRFLRLVLIIAAIVMFSGSIANVIQAVTGAIGNVL